MPTRTAQTDAMKPQRSSQTAPGAPSIARAIRRAVPGQSDQPVLMVWPALWGSWEGW